jgi:hypothetical protein
MTVSIAAEAEHARPVRQEKAAQCALRKMSLREDNISE